MTRNNAALGLLSLGLLLAAVLLPAAVRRARAEGAERAAPKVSSPGGAAKGVALVAPAHAPLGAQGERPVEAVRKNIQVLKGLPASQLFPLMNFVSASLGVRCNYCHVNTGGDDNWVWESDEKPSKRVARDMMRMVLDLNRNNLEAFRGGGVTCYTCHRGGLEPARLPSLPLTGAQHETGVVPLPKPADALPTAEAVLGKYVEAVGGREAAARLKTRVIRGTREASQGRSWPLEVNMKGADKFAIAVTVPQQGVSRQGFEGQSGWLKNPREQRALSAADLSALRQTAELYEVVKIREPFPAMTVTGRETVGDRAAYVLEAKRPAGVVEKFYFDAQTGLLLRKLTLTHNLLLPIPEQIDFEDYREVDGVKLPFTIRISNIDSYFSSTRKLVEIKHNVPLDDSLFRPPAADK
ncbi:MAG TPA: c-type cytochrome [Pyrinomonadaceae bacterium]|nr:c-type cytochrome [Pyrinomonadaceae bacterium]